MYSNILVPISFDDDRNVEEALGVARALAAEGGKITLLHVIEHVPAYALHYIPYVPDDLVQATRKGLVAELERLASDLPDAHAELAEGHAGRTILDQAKAMGADCIVIASHRPGMQDYLLGGTAHQVVRHAPCAVVVVR